MAVQVAIISRPAALLAQQLQKDGVTSEQIIGPLLMEIDVPNPSQRLLVEQALSTKQLTCFLARTDEEPTLHKPFTRAQLEAILAFGDEAE